jgi:DNA transformation protein and related proteins
MSPGVHDASKLPGLGPKSWEMLRAAGVEDAAALRELGAVRAYLAVTASAKSVSLNLLWALEGALTAKHWQAIARDERSRLLAELEAVKEVEHALRGSNRPPRLLR